MDILSKLPLNSIQAFNAAAHNPSFRKAAAELGISPPSVSYRILQLEALLDTKLYRRFNRGLELTAEGNLLAPYVAQCLDTLAQALETTAHKDRGPSLRIMTSQSFAGAWLAPRLRDFVRQHPDIRLFFCLPSTGFPRANVEMDIEIAPDYGDSEEAGMFSEPLIGEFSMPVVSPALLQQGDDREDLLRDRSLLHDIHEYWVGKVPWAVWLSLTGRTGIDPYAGIHTSNAELAVAGASNGCGIALGRLTFTATAIARGQLVMPFDEVVQSRPVFRVRCHEKRKDNPRIALFLDWLRDQARISREECRALVADKKLIRYGDEAHVPDFARWDTPFRTSDG